MIEQQIKAAIKRLRALHRRIADLDASIAVERNKAATDYAETQADLEGLLRKRRTKTVTMGGDRFTRVQSVSTTYDPDVLRKHLTREQYEAVVKEVVDTKALEALVDSGFIKPQQVREAMSERHNNPYIRVTWGARSSRDQPDREIPEGE